MPNMNSIQFKTHELLRYHFYCLGNLVTIATRYVADAYHHKEALYLISTQYDLKTNPDYKRGLRV